MPKAPRQFGAELCCIYAFFAIETFQRETGGLFVRRFHARERAGAVNLVGANGQTGLSVRFAAFGRTPEGFLLPTFLFLKKKSTVSGSDAYGRGNGDEREPFCR